MKKKENQKLLRKGYTIPTRGYKIYTIIYDNLYERVCTLGQLAGWPTMHQLHRSVLTHAKLTGLSDCTYLALFPICCGCISQPSAWWPEGLKQTRTMVLAKRKQTIRHKQKVRKECRETEGTSKWFQAGKWPKITFNTRGLTSRGQAKSYTGVWSWNWTL